MSQFKVYKGLSANISSIELVDGQMLFTDDTKELFFDHIVNGELVREPITNQELLNTLQEHIESLSNVENKSSEQIRSELTYENVKSAVGDNLTMPKYTSELENDTGYITYTTDNTFEELEV